MSLLRPEAAKLRALALTLTFSTGEAAAVLVPEDAVFWLSCSIICMVIMATPDPTPTPAPARAQRPKRGREVYMAKFADILCFFACGEFFVVGRRQGQDDRAQDDRERLAQDPAARRQPVRRAGGDGQ